MTEQPDLFGGRCMGKSATPCMRMDGRVVCLCSLVQAHGGQCKCGSCGLPFNEQVPIPSGPPADIPDKAAGRWARYVEWRRTTEACEVFDDCVRDALAALGRGETRWSIRTYWGKLREEKHVKLNDAHYSWMADEMVASHPTLVPIIERRKRRKAAV